VTPSLPLFGDPKRVVRGKVAETLAARGALPWINGRASTEMSRTVKSAGFSYFSRNLVRSLFAVDPVRPQYLI
jgi:hypothetical protein